MTMSDGFGDGLTPDPLDVPSLEDELPIGGPPAEDPATRPYPCQSPDCDRRFTRSTHLRRHMLEQHGIDPPPGAPLKDPALSGKPGRPAGDHAPQINLNLGGGSSGKGVDKDLAAVEQRAKQIATTVAALVVLMGQQADAIDINNGAEQWAASVRQLAEHEEWLKKLATGGETSARAMAWLQFAIATGTLALPILIRHEVLPSNLAEIASNMIETSATLAGDDGST